MQRSKNDVWVGMFVIIGAVAILFLALQSANLLSLNFQSTYNVSAKFDNVGGLKPKACLLYTSPSPRDRTRSRMPSSA